MENTYHCYANRELSWLRFNERVLEEAEDSRLPLCERLSFLSIFQSNLDEFFMVRIGSLQDQMLLDKNARENKTNMTSGEQIDAALAFIHKLTARRDAAYNGLLEQLAEQGIRLLDFAHMEEESRTELEKLFRQDYLPLLSSFIISKKQAFPFLKNKGIYAVAVLSTKAEKKKIGIVPCGNEIFPRLVPVPGRTGCFILSEELILHFSLFSATHWAELLGAAAVIFLCAVIYYRCREVTRHQILRAVFVLMLADEFMKQTVLLYTGQWNVTYLPLHLCSINIFVCWYDAIHQSRWSKEILYALCIPGAVVAMLSPSWQRLPVWNLLHLHSYSIHVLLILYPVLLLAGGFRPQVHHIRWVLAFLCAIATPIFFLNRLLKTNFFFLNDPQGNAITAFFAHCFGERFYLLGFLPVLAAVLLLLYLPWYRAERHQRMLCARDQVIA